MGGAAADPSWGFAAPAGSERPWDFSQLAFKGNPQRETERLKIALSNMRATIAIPVLLLTLAACGGGFDSAEPTQPDSTAPSASAAPGDDAGTSMIQPLDRTTIDRGDPGAESVPESSAPPVVGEVSEAIMEAILGDAVARTGLTEEQLEVEQAEVVTWSDGSLGCPKPGEFYTQAQVDGYWVELSGPDVWLDYRVDNNGQFKLCEGNVTPHSTGGNSPDVTTGPPGGGADS